MRRISTVVMTLVVVMGLALPALAHNFGGSGDCDGWTLNLDGEWGAVDILVDGQSVGLAQQVTIPDDSDATSRTFVVTWDKPRGQSDVTVTRTLTRSGDCQETTTTTTVPEETTTTVEEETTTTVGEETTTTVVEESTTTTEGETTTTVVEEPTTTIYDPCVVLFEDECDPPSDTTTSTGVVAPAGDDSSTKDGELPFTGIPTGLLAGLGGLLTATGGLLVRKGRS